MEITCNIIRDLLPLYAENLVSEDSEKLVEEHLCLCEDCSRQLGILKKATQLPAEVEVSSLKRLGKSIRKRRILTVMAAVLTVMTIAATAIIYMMTPVYLTAEQAIEGVELREDGGLAIDYVSGIIGTSGYATDQALGNWGIMCDTTRYDWMKAKQRDAELEKMSQEELEQYILDWYKVDEMTQSIWDRFHNIRVEYGTWTLPDGQFLHTYDPETWVEGNGVWTSRRSDINHWYLDIHTGREDVLLWQGSADSSNTSEEMSHIGPQYSYAILFFGGLTVCGVLYLISRRQVGWKKEMLERIAILAGATAVSTILVTGGLLVIGQMWVTYQWREFILTETVFLTLTALLWLRLHHMEREI